MSQREQWQHGGTSPEAYERYLGPIIMSAGMTVEEILADYEDLDRDDLLAVLAYTTRLSQVERMVPVRMWTS